MFCSFLYFQTLRIHPNVSTAVSDLYFTRLQYYKTLTVMYATYGVANQKPEKTEKIIKQAEAGFEPMASAILVRCYQELRRRQFFKLLFANSNKTTYGYLNAG